MHRETTTRMSSTSVKMVLRPIPKACPTATYAVADHVYNDTRHIALQALPYPLAELHLAKLPGIQQTLLAEVDAAHALQILRGRSADARRNDYRVSLEDDAVVDNLVNGQRDEVVVFDNGALVR